MRNFRNAALASATAMAIAATGTTAAFAADEGGKNDKVDCPTPTPETEGWNEEKWKEDNVGGPLEVLFKGTACENDRELKQIIDEGFAGLRDGKGSSQFLDSAERTRDFDIRDAAGKETYWQLIPQWARLWIDATAITGIGAFVGLVIAGVNFASYNGLVQLPEFPLPQF